jgi:formate hydrogenlyase transcriptional activator
VLIQGETGTGKELVARAIHRLSPRRERTLVKVNCAAVPAGLLESELFGHEKGAFTGAVARRIGRFELAEGGTLFLDEVSETSRELQAKLLRVLQEREFERVGASTTIRSNVRIIAATNANLAGMLATGAFRADLFYRLNVFPITMPPLRERGGDILQLALWFTHKHARRMKKTIEGITPRTAAALARYEWPGNVRELENVIERGVILAEGNVFDLPPEALTGVAPVAPPGDASLEGVERQHILRVLDASGWVLSGPRGAAAKLGMKRSTLQSRMAKLGIVRPRPAFRG